MDNPLRLTKQVVIPETNITQVLTQVYSYDNLQVVALPRYPVVRTHTVRFEQHSTSLHIPFFLCILFRLGFHRGKLSYMEFLNNFQDRRSFGIGEKVTEYSSHR